MLRISRQRKRQIKRAFPALKNRLFRQVCDLVRSHHRERSAEEAQKHTEKEKGGERTLTRISQKIRNDANGFLKIENCSSSLFFTAFCDKIRVSL